MPQLTDYEPDPRFICPCCGVNWIDPRVDHLVKWVEGFVTGHHLMVTSGYRCPKHNQAVGGSGTSSHIKGLAVDVLCDSSRLRYEILRAAFDFGVHRIGIYKTFIHLDLDRQKDPRVVWYG